MLSSAGLAGPRPEVLYRRQALAEVAALWVRAGALALAVAVPLIANPWASEAYNGIKATLIWGLTLALVAGWAAAYAGARMPRWVTTAPELAAWLLLLAALTSAAVSANPRLTFFGAPGRHEGLFTLAAYVALYLVGVHFFGSSRGVRSLARCVAIGAALAAGYAVTQLGFPARFPGEAFIRDWYAAGGLPRVFASLGSPIALGAYLTVAIPLGLGLAGSTSGPRRLVWLGSVSLVIIAQALTLTRAAWAGTVAGVVIFFVMVGRRERRRGLILSVALAAVVAVVALLTVVGAPQQIGERAAGAVEPGSGSFAQRLYIWERVLDLIRARPVTGWGLETLGTVFPYDRSSLVEIFGLKPVIVDRAHNDLLQVTVAMGIPGALAYLLFWGTVIRAGWRLCRGTSGTDRVLTAGWLSALVAYLIQLQFSFSLVAVAPVVWLMAGAACGWEASR